MKVFTLTDDQYDKARLWMDDREKYVGAIGGQFSFIFTPTSLGITVVVTDGEEKLDITNYEEW